MQLQQKYHNSFKIAHTYYFLYMDSTCQYGNGYI